MHGSAEAHARLQMSLAMAKVAFVGRYPNRARSNSVRVIRRMVAFLPLPPLAAPVYRRMCGKVDREHASSVDTPACFGAWIAA